MKHLFGTEYISPHHSNLVHISQLLLSNRRLTSSKLEQYGGIYSVPIKGFNCSTNLNVDRGEIC